MNAPLPALVAGSDGPEFFVGTSLEVQAIIDAAQDLHTRATEMRIAHRSKGTADLKAAAGRIATLANQVHILSSHLERMASAHLNRKVRL
jgi:hypothetical protein